MTTQLKGQIAWITGGGSGIGLAGAMALAKHLRFDLCPQLAGLPDCKLWVTRKTEVPEELDAIALTNVSERAIVRGWDVMLRLVASILTGRVSVGWALARWRRLRPRSLLDNSPLRELLPQIFQVDRLPQLMAEGHLDAVAVTASSYTTGEHVTFYDSAQHIAPWARSQRLSVRDPLDLDHLLASSAIPFVFPAVKLSVQGRDHYCGDGSMRQAAPISPAIHLGADRILVIGVGRLYEPPDLREKVVEYPNLAQIAGHAMSSIFLDSLTVDIERLQRINHTLSLMTPEQRERTSLRPIDVLVIAPSQRIDDIAARHLWALPPAVRAMLRAVGVYGEGKSARGAALASYLLFESSFTRELIHLGFTDALAQREEVRTFFGWGEGAERQGSAA